MAIHLLVFAGEAVEQLDGGIWSGYIAAFVTQRYRRRSDV